MSESWTPELDALCAGCEIRTNPSREWKLVCSALVRLAQHTAQPSAQAPPRPGDVVVATLNCPYIHGEPDPDAIGQLVKYDPDGTGDEVWTVRALSGRTLGKTWLRWENVTFQRVAPDIERLIEALRLWKVHR